MADRSLADFMELVWLTEEGESIVVSEPIRLMCDFIDEVERRGVNAVILASMGLGKGLPLKTPVLTPDGWRPIGTLRVGDRVTDPATGGSCRVLGVYPQGERPCFRMTFSDRTSVICDDAHLWAVRRPGHGHNRPFITTAPALLKMGLRGKPTKSSPKGDRRWQLPLPAAVRYTDVGPLPLDPYVLGVLFGDGSICANTVLFTSADAPLVEEVRRRLPVGVDVRKVGRLGWRISTGRRGHKQRNPVLNALRMLGVQGMRSHDKVLPRIYLRASIEQRKALLAGLLDTDGCSVGNGMYEFVSTSRRLARQVAALTRGLGGTATVTYKGDTGCWHKGTYRIGKPVWRVFVKTPFVPTWLERKKGPLPKSITKSVDQIEPTAPQETVCIRVSSASATFITRGFTVTHNSTVGLAYCTRHLGMHPTHRVGIACDSKEPAIDRLTTIRYNLERNRRFRLLYPDVQIDKSGRGRRTLQKLRLTANPHAKDPSIRAAGITKGPIGARMERLFGDDICTEDNSVAHPADRVTVKRAWFKTWRTRLVSSTGRYVYIGTPYHGEDLTHALVGNRSIAHLTIFLDPKTMDRYVVRRYYPGEDEEEWTIPLSDPRWPKEAYQQLFEEMISVGDASAFLIAYCGVIVDPDTAPLTAAMFRHAEGFQLSRDPNDYKFRVLYADPASSQEKKACYYAGVVLGFSPRARAPVVLDAWRTREGLTKRVERYLEARERWNPHICAIEGRHEGAFGERIEEMATERGSPFKLRRVIHGGEDEKIGRISSLGPALERAALLCDVRRWPFFAQEAESFPHGKMDALDALEGAFKLMSTWRRGNSVPRVFTVAKPEHVQAVTRKRPFGYRFRQLTRKERSPVRLGAAAFFGEGS